MGEETKSMTATVLAVLLIGIVLVVGIYILAQMQTTFRVSTGDTSVNETVGPVTEIATNLGVSNYDRASCGTITAVYNSTTNVAITAGNYTQNGCSVLFKATGAGDIARYNNTNWRITYPYSFYNDTESSAQSGNMVTALGNGGPWLTILIIVAFAVIVIGYLTRGFRG
ncbi:MAG TPA: hypothetical protein VMQ58_00970, partial [Candidatus Saccharimonadales bacterium]|nr:hypothetical protein [Candidatus Saccharimonadales bacterium]